jgi:hypothetical protein
MYCPNCKSLLKAIYNQYSFSLEGYACFRCGRKFDRSLEDLYRGRGISYYELAKKLITENPRLKEDRELLKEATISKLEKLGLRLNTKRRSKLKRSIKRILENSE